MQVKSVPNIQSFQKVIYAISHALMIFGIFFLVLLCLIAVVDIAGRRFFNTPLAGSLELSQLALSLVFFTALAYCAAHNGHIIVDTLIIHFGARLRRILQIIMHFLSLGTVAVIAWQLFLYAVKMKGAEQSTAMLEIQIYPVVYVAAIGTSMLALVFLAQLVSMITGRSR